MARPMTMAEKILAGHAVTGHGAIGDGGLDGVPVRKRGQGTGQRE